MTYTVRKEGQVLGTCSVMEQARQAGQGYAEQYQATVSVTRSDGHEVIYYPGGVTRKVWCGSWELTPAARESLEAKLYDMRYDMDLIGQEDVLRLTIRAMSDGELVNQIREYEEE